MSELLTILIRVAARNSVILEERPVTIGGPDTGIRRIRSLIESHDDVVVYMCVFMPMDNNPITANIIQPVPLDDESSRSSPWLEAQRVPECC